MNLDKVTLAPATQQKWYNNLLRFLKPLIILYVGTVIAAISSHGGLVQVIDFIPGAYMIGGAALYILNGIEDYLNKLT